MKYNEYTGHFFTSILAGLVAAFFANPTFRDNISNPLVIILGLGFILFTYFIGYCLFVDKNTKKPKNEVDKQKYIMRLEDWKKGIIYKELVLFSNLLLAGVFSVLIYYFVSTPKEITGDSFLFMLFLLFIFIIFRIVAHIPNILIVVLKRF